MDSLSKCIDFEVSRIKMSTLESFVSSICLGIRILIIIDESETSNWDICLSLILHPLKKLNFDISSLHFLS
jgi:hypothetical protein